MTSNKTRRSHPHHGGYHAHGDPHLYEHRSQRSSGGHTLSAKVPGQAHGRQDKRTRDPHAHRAGGVPLKFDVSLHGFQRLAPEIPWRSDIEMRTSIRCTAREGLLDLSSALLRRTFVTMYIRTIVFGNIYAAKMSLVVISPR